MTKIVFLAVSLSAASFATTLVKEIQVTNTQAVVWVNTDQSGNCTFAVSETGASSPVNDVNETLFPGSSSDARTGSVVQGQDHWFVAGTRTAAPGPAGIWYSRALAANTAHSGTVTCGSDMAVPFQFTTSPIPMGVTYTDPVPFNIRALGNYAVPTFDFTDLTKMYVDPQTGFKFRLLTGPGQVPLQADTVTPQTSTTTNPGNTQGEILTATNWSNSSNCLVYGGSACSYAASAQDVLTVRLAGWVGPGAFGNYAWNWENTLGSLGSALSGIDSYQLALTCNGSGSAIQVDVAYTFNGVNQGTEWETQTCPASTATVTYPSSLDGSGLAAWQSANYPAIPAVIWEIGQEKMAVNTNGTAVAAATGTFNLDPRILAAGSKITINGTEYTIASVNSATSVTLTGSAGTQTAVTAYISNFGVMIRKHSATAGTLNVYGPQVRMAASASFNNSGSGFITQCSALTATDSGGHTGRFCIFSNVSFGGGAIYFVTDDLQARFVGNAIMPSGGSGQDAYSGVNYSGQSMFDNSDPNSWWVSTTYTSGALAGTPTLLKATYNPSGVAGCAIAANYQAIPLDPNYNFSNENNCNITYSELTLQSAGHGIWSQLPSALTGGKFGNGSNLGLAFIQDGYAIFQITASGQNTEAWLVDVSLSTGLVTGAFSTYMNTASTTGSYPCRGCTYHADVPSDQSAPYYGFATEDAYGGGGNTGDGPYYLAVTTPLTTTPAYTPAQCASAFPSMSTTVSWLLPYSSGCDEITLAGSDNIPCNPTSSTWEVAHMPACTWSQTSVSGGSSTQWQAGAIMPGDWIIDLVAGQNEPMAFALNISGTTWVIIRAIDAPHSPEMLRTGLTPLAHTLAGSPSAWIAAIRCNMPGTNAVSVSEATGAGIIWDRWWYGTGHGVIRSAGVIGATVYPDVSFVTGTSVRIGTLPGTANTPETSRIFNGAPFGGKVGVSGFNYVQSHPGWDGNASSFVDMAPLASSAGGVFTLWLQPGTVNVTGTLYKIPAANAFIAEDKRRLALAVWSGMFNFQDVSGAEAISGTAVDNYNYCSIDYAGATCGQAGETVGDVFMNIPAATVDGYAGGVFDYNRANAAPLGQEPLAVLQYYFKNLSSQNRGNDGRWERRVTTGFARYNGQDTYSNAKVIPNSTLLLFNCGTPNLQRPQDLCFGQMPADDPPSIETGGSFYNRPIPVAARARYAEIQFGYAENGDPSQLFCTTRQEACNTSSPSGTPYNWEGEPRTLQNCSTGCMLQIPVIPGRVVYYRARWSDDGMNWTNSSIGVTTAPTRPVLGSRR